MKPPFGRVAGFAAIVLALALVGFAASCGDGDGASPTDTPAAVPGLEQALGQVDAMIAAAEGGDLAAAEAAFEAGHDPLHEVIDGLAASDPDLAADIDAAVEDAETDFAEGADASHIVEIGQEIRDLLAQVQ